MSNRKEKQFLRDRDRMANHVARKTGYSNADELEEHDWASGVSRYDNPKRVNARGHGIRQGRKPRPSSEQKKDDKPGPPANPATKYVAKEASPPSDDLRYTIPTLSNMMPRCNYGLINHTAEGYLNVIEQSHAKMAKLDNRVTRTLPLPIYTHNCVQLYHLHMLKIAYETGQSATWTDAEDDVDVEDLERLLNSDTVVMPAEIYDWLKGLGRFKDKTGYDYVPNVPISTVPKKKRPGHIGGDFGLPDGESHNSYEISISPLVTRLTVQALLEHQGPGNVAYQPLPDNLTPANGVPTPNLLGYRPNLRPLHPETLTNYEQALESWSNRSLATRIGYNPVLWSKQNAVMGSFADKMELKTGMPPTDKGSLSLYGTIVYDEQDAEATLRRTSGYIESASDLDPGSLSSVAIKTYRRRRDENAPGYCYVAAGNVALPNWEAGINNSYLMEAPYMPTYGAVDLTLNAQRFRREVTEGRYGLILDEITRLTLKK